MDDSIGHPNLLFIMTDQQRFDALSCHNGWIKTPNLDRLAASSVDLQQHYAQAPVCVPSRCSLFSGRYPHSHGVLENDGRLSNDDTHLFKVLRKQNYHISYCGKNHLLVEEDLSSSFDFFDDKCRGDVPVMQLRDYEKLEAESLELLSSAGSFKSGMFHDFSDEVTLTGRIANSVIRRLEKAPKNRPWCVVASFSDPHVPHLAPRRFESLYPPDDVPLPRWSIEEYSQKHNRMKVKRGVQKVEEANETDKKRYLSVYGSMCTFVDEQIGRILSELERRKDANSTITVFVSDHGDFCWHQGLVKKDLLLYDDLIHVPALISWPGKIKPGKVCHSMSEHIDILPTLLELAGIPVPENCEGRSMVKLLKNNDSSHRDQIHAEVCYEGMRSGFDSKEDFVAAWRKDQVEQGDLYDTAIYNVPGDQTKCVRTLGWKYIRFGDGFEELYDLEEDVDEARNLAQINEFEDVLQDLRQRMKEWLENDTQSSVSDVLGSVIQPSDLTSSEENSF